MFVCTFWFFISVCGQFDHLQIWGAPCSLCFRVVDIVHKFLRMFSVLKLELRDPIWIMYVGREQNYSGWSWVIKEQLSGRRANVYVTDSPQRAMDGKTRRCVHQALKGRQRAEHTGAPRQWEEMSAGIFNFGWHNYKRSISTRQLDMGPWQRGS